MSIKSILRAAGRLWPFPPGFFYPWTSAGPQRSLYHDIQQANPVDRLTMRRDWITEARPIETDGPGSQFVPHPGPHLGPDPWPATDDPYARPEPCDVVPDEGKTRLDALAARGLLAPIVSAADLSSILDLIDRQEAAERELIFRGMVWHKENKRWMDPETELA